MHPSCDQADFYRNHPYDSLHIAHVSLNQRGEPATVDTLIYKVAEQFKVPEVSVITRNQVNRIICLFLHPGKASLPGRSQVVPIREVETVVESCCHHGEDGGDAGCLQGFLKEGINFDSCYFVYIRFV